MSGERNAESSNDERKETALTLYPKWQLVFEKYDADGDGRISIVEFRDEIRSETYQHDLPLCAVKQILKKADEDQSGYLTYEEFEKMIHSEEVQGLFTRSVNSYVKYAVVPRHRRPQDVPDGSGVYEEQYSCYPVRLLMIIVSTLEIAAFVWDVATENKINATGPAATIFMYNPYKRYEVWRYFTYMFVHVGIFHLIVNLIVQIMLGIPLEMVHGWWRVLCVYLAGVIAGSLGTSVTDPKVFLAGASGGVYGIIAAHVATIIMNWSEMQFALLQLLVFLILALVDIGTAVYNRYVINEDKQIGYAAHLAGALAGLLVGICVLRNLEIKRWERQVWWASIVLFSSLMLAAVLWNIFASSFFYP
ncbi:rhomboid-related protein 3 [Bacillus rossius redtenbacheri]|uniref:rhomboid-related protein 3 n=1 Tax=Bacillus rossius redtenbacheri TaxID=93214 RepID=UPI002FDDB8AB